MTDDVKFGISAEDVGFAAAMERAKVQAQDAAESIATSFERLTGTFEKLSGALAGFTAILAGGEAFKEMISSNVEANVSAQALGRQFGLSATNANILNIALASVHVTQEQFSAAGAKLTQQLNKNEAAFTTAGIATRDAAGNLRPLADIMADVNTHLLSMSEGTARGVEAAKFYGRAWIEVAPTLKLTTKAQEEAAETARELGLQVSVESVAAVNRYRDAMNSVHEVIEGFERVISTAVMPVLSAAGEWFRGEGPAAIGVLRIAVQSISVAFSAVRDVAVAAKNGIVDIVGDIGDAVLVVFGQSGAPVTAMEFFENVLRVIEVGFIGARTVIQVSIEGIVEVVGVMTDGLRRLAQTSIAVFNVLAGRGSWSDVQTAWDAGTASMEARAEAHEARMKDILTKGAADAQAALMDEMGASARQTKIKDPTPGKDSKPTATMEQFEAELEIQKAAYAKQTSEQGSFIEFSLAQELKFWQSKLSVVRAGSADYTAVQKNIAKLSYDIAKESNTEQLAALKASEAAYKGNLDAKLALAQEYAKKVRASEGAKAGDAADAEVLEIQRELEAQRTAIAEVGAKQREALEMFGVQAQENAAQLSLATHQETQTQLLAQEQGFENQRYAIRLDALNKEKSLLNPSEQPEKIAELNAQIEALTTSHLLKMQNLTNQSTLEQTKLFNQLFTNIQNGWAQAFEKYLKGSATIGQTVRSMFTAVGSAIADALAQMAAKAIATMIEQWAVAHAIKMKQLSGDAATAASGAYSATAAIPYVGPILAPLAASAAFAGTMAFGSSLSAAGGYDIPAGVNPLVQTHQKEMILPAKYADTIRDLADKGGAGGGGDTHHYHINAVDAASFKRLLNANKADVAGAVHSHLRATGRAAPAH